ncbi:hypothetical protein IFM61392_08689, partial [Aspergillus lentulus]
PPPPPSAPPTAPAVHPSHPPPPPAQTPTLPPSQPMTRSTLDPSAYTLTNGGTSPGHQNMGSHGIIRVEDNRFKFQSDGLLPKPRPFVGGPRRYRAGRGSSVPLDLSALSG